MAIHQSRTQTLITRECSKILEIIHIAYNYFNYFLSFVILPNLIQDFQFIENPQSLETEADISFMQNMGGQSV